jgi:hypothetical protein
MGYGIVLMVLSWAASGHVMSTGRSYWWLLPIFLLPPFGAVAYAIYVMAPDIFGGARRAADRTSRALDPGREYREAKAALDETPTVRNQARVAHAAALLGRHDEAKRLFRQAAHGVHAEDPALLLGLANALLELGRGQDALEALAKVEDEASPAHTLALGRALDAVGRAPEAETTLKRAAELIPGFEGQARYAAFLARHNRREEARALVSDMDQRLKKLHGPFRKEARHWRDLAARALG